MYGYAQPEGERMLDAEVRKLHEDEAAEKRRDAKAARAEALRLARGLDDLRTEATGADSLITCTDEWLQIGGVRCKRLTPSAPELVRRCGSCVVL